MDRITMYIEELDNVAKLVGKQHLEIVGLKRKIKSLEEEICQLQS